MKHGSSKTLESVFYQPQRIKTNSKLPDESDSKNVVNVLTEVESRDKTASAPDKQSINEGFDSAVSQTEAHSGYPYDKRVSLEYQTVTSSEILWAMCGCTHKHAWVF